QEMVNRIRAIWNRFDLQLDLPLIDLQHIWLIALVVRLEQTVTELDVQNGYLDDLARKTFLEVLTEALDFSLQHFVLEENLLAQMEYPELEGHARYHQRFIAGLKRHAREFNRGEADMARRLLKTLKQWLFNHIAREDREYYLYFKEQGKDTRAACQTAMRERHFNIRPEQQDLYYSITRQDRTEAESVSRESLLKMVSDIWYKYNLKIGVPMIDMQHLWLIRQVVELDYAIHHEYEARREYFNAALADAITYIKEHFSTEEKIMRHFDYEHIEEHRKQHRHFVQFVQNRNEQYKAGDEKAIFGLLHDLKEWLITHIAVEDKKLFFYFHNRRPEVLAFSRKCAEEGEFIIRRGYIKLYKTIVQEGPVTDPEDDNESANSEVTRPGAQDVRALHDDPDHLNIPATD
ncbi:MAG: hemerythrin family protein, partial [Leptospiraceae bacterium]|nr:hemerythrin family protein [Leptospiraceae bacterium]